MKYKIERIDMIPDQSIECCVCQTHTSFHGKAEMKKIIKAHAACIGGDPISFKVSTWWFPTMSANCEFCNAKDAGEERWGVYVCASCEVVMHRIKGMKE